MATTNILDLNNRVSELEKNKDSGGGTAEDVTYDNTASHLEATDVQAAIDELSGEIAGLSADDVSYDGTDSGLSAVTVQSAIDETVNKIETIGAVDVSYDNTSSGLTATDVQGAIDEVTDRIASHVIDHDFIDISSYIYDAGTYNEYVCPHDGYVVFKYTANSDGGLLVKTDTNFYITMATTRDLTQSIYYRKGTIICFGSTPAMGRFYPLI